MSAEATTIFGYADFILTVKCAQINLAGAEIKIILACAYKQPVKQWLKLLFEILP